MTHHAARHLAIAAWHRQRFVQGPDDELTANRIEIALHRACATRTPADAVVLLRLAALAKHGPALLRLLKNFPRGGCAVGCGGDASGSNQAGGIF